MNHKRLYLKPEFWAAILVTAFGIFQWLQKLEVDLQAMASSYWPVIFLILGTLQLLSKSYRVVTATLILYAIGIFLLQQNLQFIPTDELVRGWKNTMLILFNTTDMIQYFFTTFTQQGA